MNHFNQRVLFSSHLFKAILLIICICLCSCAKKKEETGQSSNTKAGNKSEAIAPQAESIKKILDEYDINGGNYYISFHYEEGKLYLDINYYKESKNVSVLDVDLSNLKVYSDVKGYLFSDEIDTLSNEYIRMYLLQNGMATLIDEGTASKDELESQQYARDNNRGIWAQIEENKSDTSGEEDPMEASEGSSTEATDSSEDNHREDSQRTPRLQRIILFFKGIFNNPFIERVISWVFASVFAFSTVTAVFLHIVKTRRCLLFFGGDTASGKTTLNKAIMDDYISEDELKSQTPTRAMVRSKNVRDDNQKKITVKSTEIDIPGENYHEVINVLSSFKEKFFRKVLLVIVVAPTRAYCGPSSIQQDYVDEQKTRMSMFWAPVIKAKATKVNTVILFINKSDLMGSSADNTKLFQDHRSIIENACREANVKFLCITGSSVKRDGIRTIMGELISRK